MTSDLARPPDSEIISWKRAVPRAFSRSLTGRLALTASRVALATLLVIGLWRIELTPQRVWQGLGKLGWLLLLMFPPRALMFVNVVGLGPFAGVMAIAVSDTGTLAKLFAEAIENVERRQIDGVLATGANRLHVMRFGILPQVLPIMLSHTLYFFESNMRSATILGVVGAGGIGLQLADRLRVNNWDEVTFILLMILPTVALIDRLSRTIRGRFI